MSSRRSPLSTCLAILFLPAFAASVHACSCLETGPPCQAYWNSSVVFAGTPLDISRIEVERDGHKMIQRLVRFRVEEAFSGGGGRIAEVLTGAWGGDCGYDFEVGRKYLVYGYTIDSEKRIGTGICTRTRPLSEAGEDLDFIRALPSAPQGATIYGTAQRYTVNLESGGSWDPAGPITGAMVVAASGERRQETVTGSDGRYRFSGLPPGKYTVRVTLPAKLSPAEEQTFEVRDRGCAEFNVRAVTDGRIAGRLLDSQGRPLAIKSVDLLPVGRDGKLLRHLWSITNEDGSFQYTNLPPGRYVLGVNTFDAPDEDLPYRKTFYPSTTDQSAAEIISLDEGQHLAGIDFRLPPALVAREITGVVVWPDGRPAAGAEISLKEVGSGRAAKWGVKTDPKGLFKLQGYEGLPYRVEASIPADPNWNPDSGEAVELLTAPEVDVTPSAQTRPLRLVINTRRDGIRRTKVVVGAGRKPTQRARRRKRP
ncbi:MAG TPA: carboxypeptidase regulatory-like domain-containing protein [Pyrinomonadaceae bacterium]|nr:carboxypeptidase regulatory-like domain-containing protein [Pyrinomonadaceae bacterium]